MNKRIRKNGSALVVCSGGLDSTVALFKARREYRRIEAVTFRYGQNHAKRENAAAKRTCAELGVPLTVIDLSFIGRHFASSLLRGASAIPEGHYAAKSMASTVVPFRNGIMLSVAAGLAESKRLGNIVLGNHAGDHFIYPDCRPDFIKGMSAAIEAGTARHIHVVSPFCEMTKSDIVSVGAKLSVPFAKTYSCYKGGKRHCGKCGTCVERKEAFEVAGVEDPTDYEA